MIDTCSMVRPVSTKELGMLVVTLGDLLRHQIGGLPSLVSVGPELFDEGNWEARSLIRSVRLDELDMGDSSPGLLLEFLIRFRGVCLLLRSNSERPLLGNFFVRDLETRMACAFALAKKVTLKNRLSEPVGKTMPSSDSDVVESDVESD